MKKNISNFIAAAALFCSAAAVQAQGLQGIIVEDYYTISAADETYINGGAISTPITAGTKVYRIYVDMAPNYKLNTINGSPLPQGGGPSPNPLDITTTTLFWNDDNFGSEIPPNTSRLDERAAFDSYITIGVSGRSGGVVGCGANTQQAGLLKTADTNGNLTLCSVYSGFPAGPGTPDGNAPPATTIPALAYNIGGLIDFTALQTGGPSLVVIGDAWSTLPNGPGVDAAGTNRVLIGQFTTDGVFSFHINVQLSSPTNVLETYVWNQAGPGEVVDSRLTYPSACTPAAITSATSNSPICSTGNLTLDVVATGTGPLTYLWTGAGTITNAGTPNATVTGATTGNYTIAVSNACGNPSQNVAVVVNQAPNAGTNGTLTVCSNSAPVALGSSLGGTPQGGGAWTGPSPVVNGNYDAATMNPGVYTYTVTGTAPCANASATVTVTENAAPNAGTNGTLTVCSNSAPVALGTGLGGAPQGGGAWTGPSPVVNGNYDAATMTPGVYTYTVTGTTPCANASATVTVTENTAVAYYADVDGDGFGAGAATLSCSPIAGSVTNNTDGCPTDALKQAPGVCGCGVADTDTDNDGLADCVDPCPAGPNPGTSCNDNNACTINDVIGANCQCAGTLQDSDSDGICDANDNCPNLSGQQGDACNDGNAATINDVITANCVCAGVQPNDCLGIPGGTAQPGTSCNDNNAATGNDTWSANCVCVGQLIDCLNVPGGSALPGTTCNDNNACTINDVYQANCSCAGTLQDSDSDGICDANDNCPNLAGVQGDACNDGNAATINDVITANCVCVGTLLGNDCLGVPGGSAQPGTSCDDGLATTGNDTWNANCVCVGQLIDCLNVPGGSALPGTACNDNNACTINDVYQANCSCAGTLQDSDSDGICDANDNCPNLPGVQGDVCDDFNPATVNDVITANCVCIGTLLGNDCLGIPGGSAQPGTSCDDGLATTGNDTWSPNCVCVGQPFDCLNVPGGSALPGTACNDNDPNTGNDTWSANCVCSGTPLVTDCLGIPGGTALPGTACNDNNAGTINDVWSANCVCAGTTVTCVDWTLTISTDGAGSETTWQIVDASNSAVIGSGGPYSSNTTTTETICIPFGGCFNLIVSDAGGNGITGGGYVLRDDAGNRVIDNAGNGAAFTTTSQVAQPFCSPVGTDKLLSSSCDKENWNANQFIIASSNAAVSAQFGVGNQTDDGYEFWFFNPNGGYSRRVFISHANPNTGAPAGVNAAAHLRFSSITSNPVPANQLLNVRIRTRVNGVSSVYGAACRFKLEVPPSLCATTQLVPTPGSTFSCGATGKIVGASGNTGRIFAVPATRIVSGSTQSANRYQFQMSVPAEGYVRNIQTTTTTLILSAWGTNPLLCGTFTYEVLVRASFDNGSTWCPYGNSCTVEITNNQAAPFCTVAGSAFAGNADRIFTDGDEALVSTLSMWPNPNRGEQLFITIDRLEADVTTATVDIFDLVGKKVSSRTIAVNGTTLNTVIDLDGTLSGGIYVVNLTAGEQTFTQRLVIQ